MEAVHALQPAIVVACFSLHVGLDFGVGQDEKGFLVQAFDDDIRYFICLHHAISRCSPGGTRAGCILGLISDGVIPVRTACGQSMDTLIP